MAVDPNEGIDALKEGLERLATMRRKYQDQQAAGHMTLDELGERLSELDEDCEGIRRQLESVDDRRQNLEELENEHAIVFEAYAGYASLTPGLFPPEERRRLYNALGLKVNAGADGNIEILGNLEGNVLPTHEKAKDLVSSVTSWPEGRLRREYLRKSLRATVAERHGGHRWDVMSRRTTLTCSGSSTPPTPPST